MTIYFAQPVEGGLVKIGCTSMAVSERLYTLQAGSPVPLVILGTLSGDQDRELRLHRRFRKLRRYGEWFEPGAELLTFIATSTPADSRCTLAQARYLIRSSGKVQDGRTRAAHIARSAA